MMAAPEAAKVRRANDKPSRAVIDIGSNTVRLVIYTGPRRAPAVWLNEKVTARLGRDLAESGLIPEKAAEIALRGLARFATIIADAGVSDVRVVGTAAVREAGNGAAFVERVRALGLDVRVLTGEEEAAAAAQGVIGAFPGAAGVVADLGGGSLELVGIADGACAHGVSLPLGTLRLPALRSGGSAQMRKAVAGALAAAGWEGGHPGPLYLVGGTWRALANFAMYSANHPLSDPHALQLTLPQADEIAKRVARMSADELAAISGVPGSRAANLPDAAAMLRPLVSELKPSALVFSSWGLREGLLFGDLSALERAADPLLASVAVFAEPRGSTVQQATKIAAWTAAATGEAGTWSGESERLRLASTLLAMAAVRVEPNMRLDHSVDWALHKRWLGLDHRGRALIAAALRAACGKPEPTAALLSLAAEADLRDAAAWGLAIRLCRRFAAGSQVSLMTSRLERQGDALVLMVAPSRMQMVSDAVENDLKALSQWLGLAWRVEQTKA
jgi:exopolyphosphatase / guanosine-5'-triphosphate,3'-diphosphate pyrophosphatase